MEGTKTGRKQASCSICKDVSHTRTKCPHRLEDSSKGKGKYSPPQTDFKHHTNKDVDYVIKMYAGYKARATDKSRLHFLSVLENLEKACTRKSCTAQPATPCQIFEVLAGDFIKKGHERMVNSCDKYLEFFFSF